MTFRVRFAIYLVAAFILGIEAARAVETEIEDLVATVVISRHGVRSPIADAATLDSISSHDWPSWPVPAGELTPRGVKLAEILGWYYRASFADRGLLPSSGCPTNQIVAWADAEQRTMATATALLRGMFPGCTMDVGSVAMGSDDPLFHPIRANVCRFEEARVRRSIASVARPSLAQFAKSFDTEIALLQAATNCCKPTICRSLDVSEPCRLTSLRNKLNVQPNRVDLSGPIAIGSLVSEIFLLQYAEGLAPGDVGWGKISTPNTIIPLMRLHSAQFDLVERSPYVAARQGSALAQRLMDVLQSGFDRPDERSLTLLVGHDTNLANIGGLLGLSWKLPSYLPNETPPAGALHFDLLRVRSSGDLSVRIQFVAQSPDQMRNVTMLRMDNPPEVVPVRMSLCKLNAKGDCPWREFKRVVSQVIVPSCVPASRNSQ